MKSRHLGLAVFAVLGFSSLVAAQDFDPDDPNALEEGLDSTIEDLEIAIEDLDVEDLVTVEGLDASAVDVSDLVDAADVAANIEAITVDREPSSRHARRAVQLLHDPDPRRRASAARAIGNLGRSIETSALMAALEDRAPVVRRAASDSLAKIGGFEALGALRKALRKERVPANQRAFDKAIGTIEDRLFSAPGTGEPVMLTCPDGRKFILLRKVPQGYCPYDGSIWTLK